ncbi:hypothetical protein CCP2SC5_270012 [Azospirillaceae bacterium]
MIAGLFKFFLFHQTEKPKQQSNYLDCYGVCSTPYVITQTIDEKQQGILAPWAPQRTIILLRCKKKADSNKRNS